MTGAVFIGLRVFSPAAPAIAIPLDAQPGFTGSGLVTPHRTACLPVPDVLVGYLRERQATVDFSSLQRLADPLGKLFWADLEAHQPGISSLRLPAMPPPRTARLLRALRR